MCVCVWGGGGIKKLTYKFTILHHQSTKRFLSQSKHMGGDKVLPVPNQTGIFHFRLANLSGNSPPPPPPPLSLDLQSLWMLFFFTGMTFSVATSGQGSQPLSSFSSSTSIFSRTANSVLCPPPPTLCVCVQANGPPVSYPVASGQQSAKNRWRRALPLESQS